MFENIGGKIKGMAKFFCWVGIIGSVSISMVFFSSNNNTAAGIAVLIGGPICSWLGSLMTYGFGELIEKVESIDKKLKVSYSKSNTFPDDFTYESSRKKPSEKTATKTVIYDDLPDL